jgi:hypothetical protein
MCSLVLRCVRISRQVVRLGRREGFEGGLHTCDRHVTRSDKADSMRRGFRAGILEI